MAHPSLLSMPLCWPHPMSHCRPSCRTHNCLHATTLGLQSTWREMTRREVTLSGPQQGLPSPADPSLQKFQLLGIWLLHPLSLFSGSALPSLPSVSAAVVSVQTKAPNALCHLLPSTNSSVPRYLGTVSLLSSMQLGLTHPPHPGLGTWFYQSSPRLLLLFLEAV